MRSEDTIVALATTAGPAARLIVRTSGPRAFDLAAELSAPAGNIGTASPAGEAVASGGDHGAGRCADALLRFGDLEVPARLYAFAGPRSHTGQDVVEYHLPGNPLLGRLLIDRLLRLGARQAQPGEFSARAFFNGKLRLDEAEGVAAVISATNDRELSAARKLRFGELSRRLEPPLESLAELLASCELGIDFTEEDVVVLAPTEALRRIEELRAGLQRLLAESVPLEQLARLPRVVLVGRPNAGKSTLLNALAGYRRAVASEQAGTTRDVLHAEIDLPGGRVTLIDLAGLADAPVDALDAEAVRRATHQAQQADVLVLLRDAAGPEPDPPLPREPDLVVLNKIDAAEADRAGGMAISALRGDGLPELRRRLGELAFGVSGPAESLALSARHREHIQEALALLEAASGAVQSGEGAEILALHLREALDALGEILGVVSPDDLLGRIFGRFCIGK